MTPNNVLLAGMAAEQANEISAVLEFIGYHALRVDGLEAGSEVLAVIVGHEHADDELNKTLESLNGNGPPPLLAMGDRQERRVEPFKLLGCLGEPLKYAQFRDVLQKAEIFWESKLASHASAEHRPIELFRSLVGNSRAIQNVRRLIDQVAPTDANVLILGESGTGKEVAARNIHYFSQRRGKPFVALNCGAVPAELLESELFGHEKGAFTGAHKDRRGRFELADGGTLFLDEIGDMPTTMQIKLLRVLEERCFERVGATETQEVDVRIIAATNANLLSDIREGKFREDLYFRLNVFPIDMPPLRSRMEDIPLLVNELIRRLEHEKRGSVHLTPAAVLALCQYRWPGNVRELANLVERLAILHPFSEVTVSDLPSPYLSKELDADSQVVESMPTDLAGAEANPVPRLPAQGIDLKTHLAELESSFISQALKQSNHVVAHAAKLLQMRRTTLVEKMRKYGLS
ncbi:MAG: sigma-54 dependent transcriptional regulator [Gammaproteobacteria bacterium]